MCAAAWCSQALAAAAAVSAAGGRSDGGNFLDDKQWLTTISQYDKEVGQWNKFRDVSAAHPQALAHQRAAPRRGPRRPGAGGRRARFPEKKRGVRGAAAAHSGWRSWHFRCPPRPVQGEGLARSRHRSSGLTRFPLFLPPPHSPTVLPPLPRPPKVCEVLALPSQLLMVFLPLVNTANVPWRCIAPKVTRIDPVTNGPLRNLREDVGRCKIYKCPLSRGGRLFGGTSRQKLNCS